MMYCYMDTIADFLLDLELAIDEFYGDDGKQEDEMITDTAYRILETLHKIVRILDEAD